MKKILRIVAITFVLTFVLLVIYANIRDKREDTQNIDLNLPLGRMDILSVKSYTDSCVATTRKSNEFPSHVIGISMNVPPIDETYYSLSKEIGATWMRTQFNWRDIEQADGSYNWTQSDQLVRDLHANNFRVLANVTLIPTNLKTWEDIDVHFRKFMQAFVKRYSSQGVSYYEIFNEPNLPGWGWLDRKTKPDGYIGEYAILLAVANQEIRKIDPTAVVVSGGISSDDVAGMPYPTFITTMLSFGAKQCFDVFAFHPYGHEGKFGKTSAELHTLLGDDTKSITPIWFNEYGTDKDEKLVYSVNAMHDEVGVVDAWFWFTLRDLRPDHRWGYGLTDYTYNKKEAFDVFKKYFGQ